VIETALLVAYRNDDVTEAERLAVLEAMQRCLCGEPAETAARILHHRQEAAALQLKLTGIAESRRPSA
jgi:hypothetical protein